MRLSAMQGLAVAQLLALSAAAASSGQASLHGDASPPVFLDGEDWVVSNGAQTIGAIVPGDLTSDLQRASVIGDPLYDLNFVPQNVPAFPTPVWDASNWTYVKSFDVGPAVVDGVSQVWLTFEGVKMAADVWLNGQHVGFTNDQWMRYSWDVMALLKPAGNELKLDFGTSKDERNNEARYMACSGGWDWSFVTNTATSNGWSTFSKGIWKSVYLLPVEATVITDVKAITLYSGGTWQPSPIQPGSIPPFTVSVTTYLQAVAPASGTLTVSGDWAGPGSTASWKGALPAGNSSIALILQTQPNGVGLWWPNGIGDRPLYNISVAWTPDAGSSAISVGRRIGFRSINLITVNATTAAAGAAYAGGNGSGNFTMRLKLNGADIFARGANIVPMEQMEVSKRKRRTSK